MASFCFAIVLPMVYDKDNCEGQGQLQMNSRLNDSPLGTNWWFSDVGLTLTGSPRVGLGLDKKTAVVDF